MDTDPAMLEDQGVDAGWATTFLGQNAPPFSFYMSWGKIALPMKVDTGNHKRIQDVSITTQISLRSGQYHIHKTNDLPLIIICILRFILWWYRESYKERMVLGTQMKIIFYLWYKKMLNYYTKFCQRWVL